MKMKAKVTSSAGQHEVTVTMPRLRPTKLQKEDGCTRFKTRSAAVQSANNFAKKFGLCVEFEETAKAAKKSCR